MRSFRPREAPKSPVLSRIIPMKNRKNTDCAAPVNSARRITPDLCGQSRFTPDLGAVQAEQQKRTKNGDVFQAPSPASWDRRAPARHGVAPHRTRHPPAGLLDSCLRGKTFEMPFPRAPTGLLDSCVTPASVTPAQAGVQKPAGFLLAQTLKNAVSSCGRRPTGFLCDPCPRFPCASRGPDPVRLHSAEPGTRHRFRRCGTPPGMVSATACGAGLFRYFAPPE